MELLTRFSQYLLTQPRTPSRATLKNYTADVRRFIRWYENSMKSPFDPNNVTGHLLLEYKRSQTEGTGETGDFSPSALRSVERYLSSLRKFFSFLLAENIISTNPFDLLNEAKVIKKEADPWKVEGFKNSLYAGKASPLTIKNYLNDLQQFISWLTAIAGNPNHFDLKERNLLQHITPALLEEYKMRLLNDVKASPSTVNRKLSSLRKYILWAQSQGMISSFEETELPLNVMEKTENEKISKPIEKAIDMTPGIMPRLDESGVTPQDVIIGTPLPTLEISPDETTKKRKKKSYSAFPPIRLMQKLLLAGTFLIDYAVVFPIHLSTDKAGYLLWKLRGSPVFIPETQMTLGMKGLQLLKSTGLLRRMPERKPKIVATLPKSFYAPLALSMRFAPLHQKAWFHLRYTRPKWYRKYHSFAIAHYIHAALLIICMTAGGYGVVQAMSKTDTASIAYASLPDGPPRLLSFKGKLTSSDATPITANTNLRFSIYNDPTATGAAQLWEEVQNITPDATGEFATVLGKYSVIPQRLFTENARLYIGMTIETEDELKPRKQIPTEVFAATADSVQGLRPITDPQAGQRNTLLALDSSGNLTIGGKADPKFQATGGSFTLSGETLILSTMAGSDTDVIIEPDGLGKIDLRKPLHNTSNSSTTPEFAGAVEIADSLAINATGSAQSALYINQNSTGPLISASVSGIAKFTLENNGSATFGDSILLYGNTLDSTQTTFSLLSNPINLNIGTSATALSLGSSGGVTTINSEKTVLSGNVTIGGTAGLNFDDSDSGITFSGQGNHLISATAGSLQLGEVALKGKMTVLPNVSIIPSTTEGVNNLGSEALPFDTLYVNAIVSPSLITTGTASSSGNQSFSGTSTTVNQLNGGSITWQTSPGGDSGLTPRITLLNNGNVGIGTTTPQNRLDLGTGSGEAMNWISTSSRRFKEDITAINDPLGKIGRLQGVYYTWDQEHGGKRALGFIAEEVGAIIPEVVEWESNGTDAKGINYGHLTALAIEGIKAQQEQISSLQNAVAAMKLEADRYSHLMTNDGRPLSDLTGLHDSEDLTEIRSGITSPFIDVQDLVASGNLQAKNGTVLSLRTNSLQSTDEESTLSLRLGKSEVVIRGRTDTRVAAIDDEGNASFMGSLTAQSAELNDLVTVNASIAETLTVKKLIAEDFDLSEEGLTRLVSRLNTRPNPSSYQSLSNHINTYPTLSENEPSPASASGILSVQSASGSAEEAEEAIAALQDAPLTTDYHVLASDSAQLALASANIHHHTGTESLSGTVLPSGAGAVFADVSVADTVTVSGNFILSEHSLDVVGDDLQIQPMRSGGVSFMAGLITIDTGGNLTVGGNAVFARNATVHGTLATNVLSPIGTNELIVRLPEENDAAGGLVVQNAQGDPTLRIRGTGDVQTEGTGSFSSLLSQSLKIMRRGQVDATANVTIASSSAGTATILPGQTQRTVYTPFVSEKSLIYLTPTSDTQGYIPYIARQTAEHAGEGTEGSFTIQINRSITKPIKVNWWIVN